MAGKSKFVITDYGFPNVDAERRIIESAGGELAAFHAKTAEEVIEAGKDADVLLAQWAPVSRQVIEALPNLKAVISYGIGVDNVDLEAAKERGVQVANVPDYCIDEVADHTVSLALALSRQLTAIDDRVRRGEWKIVPPKPMPAYREMTFVTVGYGRIARAVLDRVRGFKFKLTTYDPYLPASVALPADVQKLELSEALKTADIVSLHAPLTPETHHILNAEAFAQMKPTAVVVNTSRGGLVDTLALAEALKSGKIAAAGIDVFEKEPLEDVHPLRNVESALLTSHVAWYSERSVPELQRLAAEEAVRAARGEKLNSRVV